MKEICKNCTHWKNTQRELNYHEDKGICINPAFKFNAIKGRIAGLIDTENLNDREQITGDPSQEFESKEGYIGINHSYYLFVTDEEFGCNCFLKK